MNSASDSVSVDVLTFILRVIGSASLLGLIFVFVPYSWMNDIHALLGLGVLSDQPVVGYLARSVSAMYALLGGLMWVISVDVNRYRSILVYLSYAFLAFGAMLVFIDWAEGLPFFWKMWEGPFIMVLGAVMLRLSSRLT